MRRGCLHASATRSERCCIKLFIHYYLRCHAQLHMCRYCTPVSSLDRLWAQDSAGASGTGMPQLPSSRAMSCGAQLRTRSLTRSRPALESLYPFMSAPLARSRWPAHLVSCASLMLLQLLGALRGVYHAACTASTTAHTWSNYMRHVVEGGQLYNLAVAAPRIHQS